MWMALVLTLREGKVFNVLLVTNMYPSEGDHSWRGSFVKEQIESIQSVHEKINFDIVHIKGRVSGGGNWSYFKAICQVFKKVLKNDYNLIHCHHAFCVLISILTFKPVLYTVHEGELNNSWTSIVIKVAIFFSNKVIYVNKNEYERSCKKEKAFIPCGIDLKRFRPYSEKPERVLFFPADPSREIKNARLLMSIEAQLMSEYPEFNIKYGGDVPREKMQDVMAKVFLVISIGKFESDGLVAKEAMASNVPLVSTDVGNVKYYLGDRAGIIIAENSDELLMAIRMIIENRENYVYGRELLIEKGAEMRDAARKVISFYLS